MNNASTKVLICIQCKKYFEVPMKDGKPDEFITVTNLDNPICSKCRNKNLMDFINSGGLTNFFNTINKHIIGENNNG